eukprot:c34511_g1_i1 orf=125-307(+)
MCSIEFYDHCFEESKFDILNFVAILSIVQQEPSLTSKPSESDLLMKCWGCKITTQIFLLM